MGRGVHPIISKFCWLWVQPMDVWRWQQLGAPATPYPGQGATLALTSGQQSTAHFQTKPTSLVIGKVTNCDGQYEH